MHGTRVAIVTLDLVGIGRDVADPIFADLAARYRLARSNVALCCSHTHSGPVVGRNLHTLHYDLVDAEQQQKIDRYATELKQSVIDVVGRAVAALAPCEVSYGAGTADFAVNRRNNKEPDVPALRTAGQLKGPEDHEVPVLRVVDARGTPVAVLFGYACHATVLDGYDWSSDYPGFAQTELESHYPQCTALFVAGCGADQNPLPRRKVELARKYGRDLAQAVRNVLDTTMKPLSGPFAIRSAVVELPLANVPDRAAVVQDAQSADRYVAARARGYLELLDGGKPIPSAYAYPIQAWRLGPLTFITLGGEVVVDYALRIKSESGAGPTWVAAYSNDVMAYIPSRRVLAEGGYEGASAMVYYGLPSPWAPSVEESIISSVRSLLTDTK